MMRISETYNLDYHGVVSSPCMFDWSDLQMYRTRSQDYALFRSRDVRKNLQLERNRVGD